MEGSFGLDGAMVHLSHRWLDRVGRDGEMRTMTATYQAQWLLLGQWARARFFAM